MKTPKEQEIKTAVLPDIDLSGIKKKLLAAGQKIVGKGLRFDQMSSILVDILDAYHPDNYAGFLLSDKKAAPEDGGFISAEAFPNGMIDYHLGENYSDWLYSWDGYERFINKLLMFLSHELTHENQFKNDSNPDLHMEKYKSLDSGDSKLYYGQIAEIKAYARDAVTSLRENGYSEQDILDVLRYRSVQQLEALPTNRFKRYLRYFDFDSDEYKALIKEMYRIVMQRTDKHNAAEHPVKEKKTFKGLPIFIEYPKGSIRHEKEMLCDYGYIPQTVGSGDHEAVDVFLGENFDSPYAFVVEQLKEDGSFDEYKVLLGFNSLEEAKENYLAQYEPDWLETRVEEIWGIPLEEFIQVADEHRDVEDKTASLLKGSMLRSSAPVSYSELRQAGYDPVEPKKLVQVANMLKASYKYWETNKKENDALITLRARIDDFTRMV
jgi:hypothetical protein